MRSFIERLTRIGPVVMSLLALFVCALGWTGLVRDPPGDEGALAHIYQLLMVGQIPLVVAFIVMAVWRRRIRTDYGVAAGQVGLWAMALSAVPLLGL